MSIQLNPTGVIPGPYDPVTITVNDEGRITSASSIGIPRIFVRTIVNNLVTIPTNPPLRNGDFAVILDDGANNELLFVWNENNSDLGDPVGKWRQIASTNISETKIDFRQGLIGTDPSIALAPSIPNNGIVKEIVVGITTAYSAGATIEIEDTSGFVYVPTNKINAQLPGEYRMSFSGNFDTMIDNGTGDLVANVFNSPVVGNATVYVEYVNI